TLEISRLFQEGFDFDFDENGGSGDDGRGSSNSERDDYQPRVLTEGWFRDSDQPQRDDDQRLLELKLRADLLYFEARYDNALEDYLTALDITEAVARCQAILGRGQEALQIARKQLDECSTDDQFMAAYNLLLDIFLQPDIAAQHSDSHRLALQNCLLLNPLCDRLWRRLSRIYAELGRSDRRTTCLQAAQHITTVLAVQESNLKLQTSHGSAGSDQRTPIAGKAMSLISFHGNYRNLPYSGRLWERLSYKQANVGFDRKRIDCGGNEALLLQDPGF
uniref:TPR_REGION domain-containing protein n=1 Tax=Macrostomum lignano TaxID=282301 RepID=A0A1I8HQR8_9PLAT